jgi:hypothetical protein
LGRGWSGDGAASAAKQPEQARAGSSAKHTAARTRVHHGRTATGSDKERENGAVDWNRTSDLVLTKDALYRLSYDSVPGVRSGVVPSSCRALDAMGVAGFQEGVAMDEREDRAEAARAERARRVAAVMRENLRKRKAQERARAGRAIAPAAPEPAEGEQRGD